MAPYDLNFLFPVRDLENDRVRLTPFVPSLHVAPFFEASAPYPEIWSYIANGPYPDAAAMEAEFIIPLFQTNPTCTLFIVFDKTRDNAIAGIMSYLLTSDVNLKTEVGYLIVLPPFHRTHVTTNAVGLLLQYALDTPDPTYKSEPNPDYTNSANTSPPVSSLGLRRVQWQANEQNVPSVRAGLRLGFHMEGILRWDRALPPHKPGVEIEGMIETDKRGRHTAILSMCWDDWGEGRKRDALVDLMNRELIPKPAT